MISLKFYALCSNCNREFVIQGLEYGSDDVIFNFENCPHCGTDNRWWIKTESVINWEYEMELARKIIIDQKTEIEHMKQYIALKETAATLGHTYYNERKK